MSWEALNVVAVVPASMTIPNRVLSDCGRARRWYFYPVADTDRSAVLSRRRMALTTNAPR